jgi:hypothetical protein
MTKFLLKNTLVMKLIKQTLKEAAEGYLLFEQDDEWKKLFFKNGKVTGAASNNKSDYLGQYLIAYGVINTDQFEETYRTQSETKKMMEIALEAATPETLRRIIFEKIIDTIFIAARWSDCMYSVVSERQLKPQTVDVALSPGDISSGLKQRISEFRETLSLIPELGARPKIDEVKKNSYKISAQEEIILNYISAGKTIKEVLAIIVPHNYLLFKSLYNLSKEKVIVKGTGAPLLKEEIIRLVDESNKCKKCAQPISDVTLSPIDKVSKDSDENKYRKDLHKYQEMHSDDPDNSLYSHYFVKAKSCFILNFYSKKLSPFAVVEITGDLERINANEVDFKVYEKIKEEGGRASLRNIIKSMEHRSEIDVLFSVDKLLSKDVIKDVEPETFIDAVKLGRNEFLERLFSKNERNKLFATDISQNLTPSMFSVISGEKCKGVNTKAEEKKTSDKATPVLHDYEMTPLMLASMIGNYEAAEFLLLNNTDPNLHNGNGVTALMLALQNGYDEIAWLLIDHKADVNAKNTNGYSALMIAAAKGQSHIVDRMIKAGVNVNQVNSNGQTALNSAVRFNHKAVAVSLIAAGIDLSISDSEGYSPLYYAETVEMTELIEKGAGNSKRIKKDQKKKKKEILSYERNLQDKKEFVPGSFPVLIFSSVLFATSYINISLLFFSGESYGLTSGSKKAMEQIGNEYCEKFKACREDIPPHVLSKCNQMGMELVSENFRDAKRCDSKTVQDCISCVQSLSCKDFYQINDSNLFAYCHDCAKACEYTEHPR